VFKFPTAKHNLAECIQKELAKNFPTHNQRRVKEERFYVLRKTKMPSALVECEFITNPTTRDFLIRPENQVILAHSIANGIDNYVIENL
jgi:N-acetylmuramoyl-L-alanine amidase